MENNRPVRKHNRTRNRKRHYAKFPFVILGILILIVVIIVAYCSSSCGSSTSTKEVSNATTETKAKVQTQDSVKSFNMSIAGDYIIYSTNYNYAQSLAGGSGYDFAPIVNMLKQFTDKCDVNYYNQETVLAASKLGVSDYPLFISPEEAGQAMVDLGYNLVSSATNHSLDGGVEGIMTSREFWNKQKDVFFTGTFSSQAERDKVNILECNDIKYSMLNYTYDTNGIPVPDDQPYLINVWPTNLEINDPAKDENYQAYKETVKKDIDAVRDKVDFLIVALHAGVEYMPEPSAYQEDMAQFLADNGVDLVIGTHPHCIEPAKYIDDTLVFFSLGNLLCAQYQDDNYNKVTSILSTFTVTKTTKDGESKITFDNLENNLMYCYYDPNTWSDYLIIPFSDPEIKNYMPDYKSVYNTYKEVFQKYDKNMKMVPCA